MNLPEQFINNMKELLKDDFDAYIASLDKPKFNAIRINNLKISDSDFFKLIGKELPKVPWSTSGYYIDTKTEFSKSSYYNAGLYYAQEPSAMSVASLLPIEKGDFVLDLCASPGGKATAIADKLSGSGYLVANDVSPSRCKALVKNIELMGITNCTITCDNHKNLEKVFVNYFDKIIVDAPCSGEGMFKTDSTALNSWNEQTNLEFQEIQLDILNSAKNMLKPNGIMSYSTCTFSLIENEIVIDKFLKQNPEFSIIPIDNKKYGFSDGLLDNDNDYYVNISTRIFPHLVDGEGHFLCLLKKDANAENPDIKRAELKSDKTLEKMIQLYKEFEKTYLKESFKGRYIYHLDSLFLVHDKFFDIGKTRTMRSGFYLGDIKNGKFKPSQNLASALNSDKFLNCIVYDNYEVNIAKYLKGETITASCQDGYVLVCLEGFPLGFGLAKNDKVKNKIGKSMLI